MHSFKNLPLDPVEHIISYTGFTKAAICAERALALESREAFLA